ncbi:MAG: hypothetical protein GY845_26635 [Planctomycetes bacterium]|nr:hypothetical protein [Planctomycetota bacterium]
MIKNEQQSENKKPGLFWRIFKWIGLSFLLLLLIAAIIFQAQWKIISLLAIVLAACTILPKPFRKLFWLSAGVVVIALIIWIFLPEDNEGWQPYTFDKELAALQAKYTVPDEENAALIYNELFETFDIHSNEPEFFVYSKPSSKDAPWLSKDHPETAQWIKGHQDTIEKLLQAAKKDKCMFLPLNADLFSAGEYIKRLPEMRKCAFLLLSAANNDTAEGRIGDALEKCFCTIQMAKHLYQQPTIIQQFLACAIERMALKQLNRFVIEGQPRPEQLQLIANSTIGVENNWAAVWPRILDFEKLYAKNMLCSIAYEVNPKGKTRLTRDLAALWRKQDPQKFPPLTYSQRKLFKAKTIPGWFIKPSSPEKVAKIFDAGYEKYYTIAASDFDWAIEPNQWDSFFTFITSSFSRRARFNYKYLIQNSVDISEGSYYKHYELFLKNLALRRGSRLLIDIKRYHTQHGTWPESLDEIKSLAPAEAFHDPTGNDAFVYALDGDGFRFYSKGINRIDQGGRRSYVLTSDKNQDDIAIWPLPKREIRDLENDRTKQGK